MIVLGVDPVERDHFWSRVDKTPECWNWTGSTWNGYGSVRSSVFGGRPVGAHRVSKFYETGVRSGKAKHLDHLCRNRLCVRPDHLEFVSRTENILRGEGPTAVNKRKTHCVNGHEFTAENTQREGEHRHCKACHKKVSREWARRRREAARSG